MSHPYTAIGPQIYFEELLPDFIVGDIMSHLHWKEKCNFLQALPFLKTSLNPSLVWNSFENDRAYAVEKLYIDVYSRDFIAEEINMVSKYGKHFKSCTIWLHKLPLNPSDYQAMMLGGLTEGEGTSTPQEEASTKGEGISTSSFGTCEESCRERMGVTQETDGKCNNENNEAYEKGVIREKEDDSMANKEHGKKRNTESDEHSNTKKKVEEIRDQNDFKLLVAVAKYCKKLSFLRIIHPSGGSLQQILNYNDSYVTLLKSLALNKYGSFHLSLLRLFYSSLGGLETGFIKYFDCLIEHELEQYIHSLDFSHGLGLDKCSFIVQNLRVCTNLRVLKCPIQCLSSSIVKSLVCETLTDLYLVNDGHTSIIDFSERSTLDWESVHKTLLSEHGHKQIDLKVHYLFKNRYLHYVELVPNPFTTSLVFDNMSMGISEVFIRKIADLYGQTIVNLAFCCKRWDNSMTFIENDQTGESFKYLGQNSPQLSSFLSCLRVSSTALLCLAESTSVLKTIQICKENMKCTRSESPENVERAIAKALKTTSWSFVAKGGNLYNIPGVDCDLLFAYPFEMAKL